MSAKSSKSLIGAFVLGAIAIAVAGVIIFGSGRFLRKTYRFVMFFPGSVKGLNVGAPVMFRGVKVGQVTGIKVDFYGKELAIVIPVYIELDPRSGVLASGEVPKGQYLKALIKKGLRAQLQLQSFITGQLVVDLDFYPGKPAILTGLEKRYPEIPTIPAPLEELTKTLHDLNLDQTVKRLNGVIQGINRVVNSPALNKSMVSLQDLLSSMNSLTKDIDSRLVSITSDFKETSGAARKAFVQAEKTLAMKEGAPGEFARSATGTLKSMQTTLEETRKTVASVRGMMDQNANAGYELTKALEEISALSRSVRSLTDYLDRHPEALIKGKKNRSGD